MTSPLDYREAVAAEVRAAMARERMTQAVLAQRAGMSRPALSDRLACKRPFDCDQIIRICIALDLDPLDLLAVPVTDQAMPA